MKNLLNNNCVNFIITLQTITQNWLITDGELLETKTFQIHDNVNNNLQKDYRETKETERYFGNYWTQFMGKRKSKKYCISQAARQSTKTRIIFVIEDIYQWDVYPKCGVPVRRMIFSLDRWATWPSTQVLNLSNSLSIFQIFFCTKYSFIIDNNCFRNWFFCILKLTLSFRGLILRWILSLFEAVGKMASQ